MSIFSRSFIHAVVMLSFVAVLQGCATVDQRVDILYQPVANATGGHGDLYLVQAARPVGEEAAAVQWIVGDITNKYGEKFAKVVTDVAPTSLVMDALTREFKAAGYRVIEANSMPIDVKKALSLNQVSLKLDVVHSVFSDETNGFLKISLQLWRNGSAVKTLTYESENSDTAITDRDVLASKTLQHALQLLMKRSVPEIVNVIEQK